MARRRFVSDEKSKEMLARMIKNRKLNVSRAEAMENQEKFAIEWGNDLNDLVGISENPVEQAKFTIDLAKAQEMIMKGESIVTLAPVRPEIYQGDIVTDIFTVDMIGLDKLAEYPIEYVADSDDWLAFAIPDDGRLPERLTVTDSVTIRPFTIGNTAYWKESYNQLGNTFAIQKSRNRFNAGFVKKINDIGWKSIMTAASYADDTYVGTSGVSGVLSPSLITAMQVKMRRRVTNFNSASANKFTLTDLYVSPEAFASYLDLAPNPTTNVWPTAYTDGLVNQMLAAGFNSSIRIHDVNVHVLDELGVGKEYETFITSQAVTARSKSKPTGAREWVIGLDLSAAGRDNFVMPIGQNIEITPDDTAYRNQRVGFTGKCSLNAGILDSRSVIIGAI